MVKVGLELWLFGHQNKTMQTIVCMKTNEFLFIENNAVFKQYGEIIRRFNK